MIPATTPPIVTALPPLIKLVPVIVIAVPTPPVLGLKSLIVGAGANMNPVLVAVPPAVVTETVPLAPVPIVAVICVLVSETIVAAVPPNVTAVAPGKICSGNRYRFPLPRSSGSKRCNRRNRGQK